jgi:ankyrin repeat protein
VPYQVQVHGGALIFVPADVPQLCRALVPPWWVGAFKKQGKGANPSAEYLAKEGVKKDVNETDHQGNSALMEAVKIDWCNGVSQLIAMKADVDMMAKDKTRAIHVAAMSGSDTIKFLVNAKANLNCQDQDPDYDPEFTSTTFGDRLEHRTALHYLCMCGNTESAKLLLEAKAQVNIRDAQMKTPLHLAIDEDQGDCIDVLLKFGADVNLGNQSSGMDNSPLMDVASAGNTQLAKKLIAAKADINKQGKQQMSALHLAARSRRNQVAEVLLAAKADMNQESRVGTALQLARKNGGVDLLKVFGVQPDESPAVSNVSLMDAAQRAALFLE